MTRPRVLTYALWYPTRDRPADGAFVREHVRAASLHAEVAVLHGAGADPAQRAPFRLIRADADAAEGFPCWRLSHPLWRHPLERFWVQPWSLLRAAEVLRRAWGRPDLIHAHVYDAGIHALVLARYFRVPLVVTEHSTAFHRGILGAGELRRARLVYRAAARVLPVSEALRRDLEGAGVRVRFRVVPNAVDTRLFSPPVRRGPPAGRVLFVGLLDREDRKGLAVLLRALSTRTASTWTLDVIGDGPGRGDRERECAAAGLTERVRFLGMQAKAEIAARMQGADLLVLPSAYETAGVVLMEALASGLPVVATRVGGIPEIVDDSCGLLVPAGDVEALGEALDAVRSGRRCFDPEAVRARGELFGLGPVGEQLTSVYREVLHG